MRTHPTPASAAPSRTSATRTEEKSLRKDRQELRTTAGCLGTATVAVGSAEQARRLRVSAFAAAQLKRDTFHCVMGMMFLRQRRFKVVGWGGQQQQLPLRSLKCSNSNSLGRKGSRFTELSLNDAKANKENLRVTLQKSHQSFQIFRQLGFSTAWIRYSHRPRPACACLLHLPAVRREAALDGRPQSAAL